MKDLKPALLLIADFNKDIEINRFDYLNECINKVITEGYMPLTPAVYAGTHVNYKVFTGSMLNVISSVYLFVDFGIDQNMLDVMDMAVDFTTVHFRRLSNEKMRQLTLTPGQVLLDVCRKSRYRQDELVSKSRNRNLVEHRFVYYRRAREITKASLAEIGQVVNADHSSVLYGIGVAKEVKEVRMLYEKYYGHNEEI